MLIIHDALFPKRFREILPILEINHTLLAQISQLFSNPDRIAAEKAVLELEEVTYRMEMGFEKYVISKGIGQSVDTGLAILAWATLGIAQIVSNSPSPPLFAYLFASVSIVFATFAGIFGPFYALWKRCKENALEKGYYRIASIFNILEFIVAVPFLGTSVGFLLLDIPPIDQESLNHFKREVGKQVEEIQDKIDSVMRLDQRNVPRQTAKLISVLSDKNTETLAKLDFRNLRADKAREFALTFFQKEFSLIPWKRKAAVKEFATKNQLSIHDAESTLRLITTKINYGVEDEDLINNLIITGSLKGVILKEQEYEESYDDLELGQITTGLAFGGRQFLEDHYNIRSKAQIFFNYLTAIAFFVYIQPLVIARAFISYSNDFYDYWVNLFVKPKGGSIVRSMFKRFVELYRELEKFPGKIGNGLLTFSNHLHKHRGALWIKIKSVLGSFLRILWRLLAFPIKSTYYILRRLTHKLRGGELDKKTKLEIEITQAALVSIYDELFNRLVKQDYIATI